VALDDVRREDWEEDRHRERAVRTARALFQDIDEGARNPVEVIDDLKIAAEPLWDDGQGDIGLVLRVARNMQPHFVEAERRMPLSDPRRIPLRVEPALLLAGAEHRADSGPRAFRTTLAPLIWLEDFVEGSDALADIIARSEPNPVAKAAVAIMGLYPAALRRAKLSSVGYEHLRGQGVRYIEAYLGTSGPRAIYERTDALAAQWFYLLVKDSLPDEGPLVRLLHETDLRTRPQHARAQATSGLRDAEYSRYCGDDAGFERHRAATRESLARFQLPRHQALVERYGYLAA
jgi:hypothetical protein